MKFKIKKEEPKKSPLRIITLGGTTNVTKNMYLYEYGDNILVVDCGIGFLPFRMLGIDFSIPDISYLLDKKEKIKAILITHGHEDHFGALPFILPKLKVPVFASRLVLGFIKNRLGEHNLLEGADLHTINPEGGPFSLGPFKITPFGINHSVPDSLGFAIETPQGLIFHLSDFKFDWTPVMDKPFEVRKVARLSKNGSLALLSDCLGANTPGYTETEKAIEGAFNQALDKAKEQVFITTVSSNISRIKQIVSASLKHNRKIVPLGRSIQQNIRTAQNLGYLKISRSNLVAEKKAPSYPQEKLTYIVAGAYGQEDSALVALSLGERRLVKIKKGATVIFSADPIPGLYDQVDRLINGLTLLGAHVIYSEVQEGLHTSGHGSEGDLRMLISLTKPKYFIPIGGTPKYMRSYALLAKDLGANLKNIFELSEGESVEFYQGKAKLGKKIETEDVYIGKSGALVSETSLQERQIMAESGVVIVIVPFSKEKAKIKGEIKIETFGFAHPFGFREGKKALQNVVLKTLKKHSEKLSDWNFLERKIRKDLGNYIYKKTKRTPLILVIRVKV